MVAALLLVDLVLVAATTIFWRDDDSNCCTIVLKCVAIGFFRPVTIIAADARLRVRAGVPFLGERRILHFMTLETGIVLLPQICAGGRLSRFGSSRIETITAETRKYC